MTNVEAILMMTFVFVLLSFVVYLNRNLINRVLNNHIIPDLSEKGYTYTRYKNVSFFQTGDFKVKNRIFIMPSFNAGLPIESKYIYVYYKGLADEERITVKITTLFLVIRKVIYSKELPNIKKLNTNLR